MVVYNVGFNWFVCWCDGLVFDVVIWVENILFNEMCDYVCKVLFGSVVYV